MCQIQFNWLEDCIKSLLDGQSFEDCAPFPHSDNNDLYNLMERYQLNEEERFILLLSFAPHIYPEALEVLINLEMAKGVIIDAHNRIIRPTAQTVLSLLADQDFDKRLTVMRYFSEEHLFYKENLLTIKQIPGNPFITGILEADQSLLGHLFFNNKKTPSFGVDFPAKKISSKLAWNDLILPEPTKKQLEKIAQWIEHKEYMLHDLGMKKVLRDGYMALFYGPPGTGKTMAAILLGKLLKKDVYKIDLSMVVSKYIGETEKNLSKVFDQAENQDWILFFDEADALFGSRTEQKSAQDRYANQEVSFLLQRVEEYSGLAVLASNFKDNIDKAFLRRFQSMIYFPMPTAVDRNRIFKNSFSEKLSFSEDVNIEALLNKYELSGGSLINVVRDSTLIALNRKELLIRHDDLVTAIRNELSKEGKVM